MFIWSSQVTQLHRSFFLLTSLKSLLSLTCKSLHIESPLMLCGTRTNGEPKRAQTSLTSLFNQEVCSSVLLLTDLTQSIHLPPMNHPNLPAFSLPSFSLTRHTQEITIPSYYSTKKYMLALYCLQKVKVTQLCPTLRDSMGYTVHGILQARILEWVIYPFSSRSCWSRNRTGVSCIAGRFFTNWAIRKTQLSTEQSPSSLVKCRRVWPEFPFLPSSLSFRLYSYLNFMFQQLQEIVTFPRHYVGSHSQPWCFHSAF